MAVSLGLSQILFCSVLNFETLLLAPSFTAFHAARSSVFRLIRSLSYASL